MTNLLVISVLTVVYTGLFLWAFRTLPREEWQILAAIPRTRQSNGWWTALNFTYYGLFTAAGVTMAAAIVFVLMAAVGLSVATTFWLVLVLLGSATPAAKIIARLVEKKVNTFTIGGAAFVGVVLAPWVILAIDFTAVVQRTANGMPIVPTMTILAIAYAVGEGTGRLACISFGCCYGKPLAMLPRWISRLFDVHHFAFEGATKKAVYEGRLDGTPLVPVQGITAVLFVAVGVIGLTLFLQGLALAAFVVTWTVTQVWRVVSEMLRADFRGDGRMSSYQILALVSAVYGLGIVFVFPETGSFAPDLSLGLKALLHPGVMLTLQLIWIVMFLYTGRSKVTVSRVDVFIDRNQV